MLLFPELIKVIKKYHPNIIVTVCIDDLKLLPVLLFFLKSEELDIPWYTK